MPEKYEINRDRLLAIGEKIRKYRTAQNISQSQLAFETETSLRQIQRIEKGTIHAGILYYINIAIVLNIDIKKLVE